MKTFILFVSIFSVSGIASPPPQDQQGQDQQEQCRRCRPVPQVCHARMVDCYNRPLYTYWGRMPTRQAACHLAMNLCQRDAAWGYGGYGARCFLLGK